MKKETHYSNPELNEPPIHKLRDVVHLIFEYRKSILIFSLVLTLPVAVYSALTHYQYTSTAKVLIKVREESLNVDPEVSGQMLAAGIHSDEFTRTEIELLQNHNLHQELVETIGYDFFLESQTPSWTESLFEKIAIWGEQWNVYTPSSTMTDNDIRESIVESIQKHLEINSVGNVLSISYSSPQAKQSQYILDVLLQLYQDFHHEMMRPAVDSQFYTEGEIDIQTQIQEAEDRLEAYKSKHNIVSLEDQKNALSGLIGQLQLRIAELQATQKALQVKKDLLQADPSFNLEQIQTPTLHYSSTTTEYLYRQIAELKTNRAELLNRYPPHSRFIQHIDQQISTAETQLEEEMERLKSTVALGSMEEQPDIHHPYIQYKQTASQLKETQSQLAALTGKLNQYQSELQELAKHEVAINRYTRTLAGLESGLSRYQSNLYRSMITERLAQNKVTNLQIVQPPTLANEPTLTMKERYRNIGLAFFVSLFGGFGMVVLSQIFNPRYFSTDQIEADLPVPVLCSIPKGDL